MKRVLITKVDPVAITESHFIVHDSEDGYFEHVVTLYGKMMFKHFGKNLRVECTHSIDGNPQPCHVFINNKFWGNRLPTAQELKETAEALKYWFQGIMDDWKKDIEKDQAEEIEFGKTHKLKPLPKIPKRLKKWSDRYKAAVETLDLLQSFETQFLKSRKEKRYEDCRIDLLDHAYTLRVLRLLMAKEFQPKKFAQTVHWGDTGARDKLSDAVWKIVDWADDMRTEKPLI